MGDVIFLAKCQPENLNVDEIIINKDTKTVYKDADWIHLVQDLYR
jgi:hypothetical protein